MSSVRELFADVDRRIRRDLELTDWYWAGRREGFRKGLGFGLLLAAVVFGAAWVVLT